MKKEENHLFVIFGASGDLTKRKIISALFSLYTQNLLATNFAVLGASMDEFSDESFREDMKNALKKFGDETTYDEQRVDQFIRLLYYHTMKLDKDEEYKKLDDKIKSLQKKLNIEPNLLFYMATPPSLIGVIPEKLATIGLNNEKNGWKRIIIEKPFGFDLSSAMEIHQQLTGSWQEHQIYRIDHYVGKETVQNILVTRFSNGIFEPLWNRNYIQRVEITSGESIGVENRGGYYDHSGALSDMVQNHLLHLTAITAMEPPSSMNPDAIRNEMLKVLQSLKPYKKSEVAANVIRGQYLNATIGNEKINGYREEQGVTPNSKTETFVAMRFFIDNWRWGGVPFYIRTGKRLPMRVTEVVIHFKPTPHFLFHNSARENLCNKLVLRIQPDEGILMKFDIKTPGEEFDVEEAGLDFHYSSLSDQRIAPAYERLIYDAQNGDSTLFSRAEEMIEAWRFLDPILSEWKQNSTIPLYGYPAGTWGPPESDKLFRGENCGTWRQPCKNLSNDGIFCQL
ncbi:MAG: glucose-6-phosphate dehydrogenase [Bacteroidales bacterium]|nr:glucose-6-phosphate dehydrogenase [Bacteroidales bacterium]